MEKFKYEICFKEVGKKNSSRTYYEGKEVSERFLIDFFGLNNSDVEWYTITRVS